MRTRHPGDNERFLLQRRKFVIKVREGGKIKWWNPKSTMVSRKMSSNSLMSLALYTAQKCLYAGHTPPRLRQHCAKMLSAASGGGDSCSLQQDAGFCGTPDTLHHPSQPGARGRQRQVCRSAEDPE